MYKPPSVTAPISPILSLRSPPPLRPFLYPFTLQPLLVRNVGMLSNSPLKKNLYVTIATLRYIVAILPQWFLCTESVHGPTTLCKHTVMSCGRAVPFERTLPCKTHRIL